MKKRLLLIWTIATIVCQIKAQVNVQDSLALVDLYNSTDGPNWTRKTNWLTGAVNTWEGVTVEGTRVKRLRIEQGNLNGPLPSSIGNLTGLIELILAENIITGEIPATVGSLENLGSLALYTNQLSGNIPASIGDLKKLEILELSANHLSGQIPASLGNITKITNITLSGNQLTGPIPASFLNFTEDPWIFLDHNQLSGPIPDGMCNVGGLWILDYNQFTFDGLECLAYYSNSYTNQKQLEIKDQNSILSVEAGGTLSAQTYKWFRNGELYKVVNANPYLILNEPGSYNVEVSNTLLPALTLYSNTIAVTTVSLHGPTVSLNDSSALVQLYNSTNGNTWTKYKNWLTTPAINWEGVQIANGRVTALYLDSAGLSGPFPNEFENLTELKKLSMAVNNLTGNSAVLGALTQLELINLSQNHVNEALPAGFGNLTHLRILNLENNQYTNNISPLWGNMGAITTLNLSKNKITGSLPASLSGFINATLINLSYNQLAGPVPASLCNVKKWILNNNLFTFEGLECLRYSPEWYAPVPYANQAKLHISNNNPVLSVNAGGTLSNNSYSWTRNDEPLITVTGDSTLVITDVGLYRVQVRNAVLPDLVLHSDSVLIEVVSSGATINSVDSLALVDLYNSTDGANWTRNKNWFTGPANTWEGIELRDKRVVALYFEQANLDGPLPGTFGNLTALEYAYMDGNQISGSIPLSIEKLTKLKEMRLLFNHLSGAIPPALGHLSELSALELSGNNLTGSIPPELGNNLKLRSLLLDKNKLTGSIPSSLGNIPGLEYLSLTGNQLTGTIPATFVNFKQDLFIFLSDNQLTGPIPAELCSLRNILWSLNGNQFTFDGLECLNFYGNDYDDQKDLTITNNNPVLSVYAGGTLSNNTYTWYKDNGAAPYAVISGDSTITLTEPGTYWAKVNNSVLTALTLFSDTITITQIPSRDPLEFSAQKCGRDVCMSWFAQQDLKPTISHFEVERSSDNHRFRKIDRVKASRKSGRQRYSSKDYSPAWGDNYYRVKQVNKDGSHVYSKVIMVEIPRPVIVYIWPNPADNYIYFKGVDKAQKVTLYSLNGQTIKQWQNVNAYQPLNISSVRRGLYVVKVVHASGEAVQLIIIK